MIVIIGLDLVVVGCNTHVNVPTMVVIMDVVVGILSILPHLIWVMMLQP